MGLAAAAVLLAAADTYVIVLALPAMMASVGIGLDRLQEATPIISGFLLGYVVVMPLLGRLSDVYGRRPVLLTCLAVFATGSLVTASAHSLSSAVAGRALQGLGGGGLVPVTLALVADVWPPERRGIPLGVIGAVQELGSVVGPLYGGVILTVGRWQTIFWVNLVLTILLAIGMLSIRGARRSAAESGAPRRGRRDLLGVALAAVAVVSGAFAIAAPEPLQDSASVGVLYTHIAGAGWLTPLTLAAVGAALLFVVWEVAASRLVRVIMPLRHVAGVAARADWLGAALIAIMLATIVVSFTSSDPMRSAISPSAAVWLPVGAASTALFVLRERSAAAPLLVFRELRDRAAAGALLTNLAVGAALMSALVDVPIFARVTVFPDSQLGAAGVLLRMLIALPIGAVAGGVLCQRLGNRIVAAGGLIISAGAFMLMTRWSAVTLADPLGFNWLHPSDPVLFACGLGFGLAVAPVNASILASVRPAIHGLASALVVVARMVGMIVGISVLAAVGLRVFYASAAALPAAQSLCPRAPLNCPAYNALITNAIIDELRAVFFGAAVCAAVAAVLAGSLLRGRPPALLRPAHA